MHQREDRSSAADAERERQHGSQRKDGRVTKLANGVGNVSEQVQHIWSIRNECANSSEKRAAGDRAACAVVNKSRCPVLFTRDLSGLQHKVL